VEAPTPGQHVLQQGFEGKDPVWVVGSADAKYKELAHKVIDDPAAHGGQRSEYLQLQSEPGTFIYYGIDVGRAPITDDLNVSLFVKASRPGVSLVCRVVLPNEHDPEHPGQVMTAIVRGDTYQLTGRWESLGLPQPVRLLQKQKQLIQATVKHEINVTDAFVDRVILNAYAGPGLTEIWTDDLEVGPVTDTRSAVPPAQLAGRPTSKPRASEVKLEGNKLLVGGKPFFPRVIRHSGTPLKTLRAARFNVVYFDETTPPDLIDHAVDLGFWIVPSLTVPDAPDNANPAQLTALNASFGRMVSQYKSIDGVLCWDLGSNLQHESFLKVTRTAQAFRQADPDRPVTADVWEGYGDYRGVDQLMLSVHRWPLMTGLDMGSYKEWLVQRRRLAPPDTYCWTWIQTHLPDWYSSLVYGHTGAEGYSEPVGPQAEQIRLMTYVAVGSGYRGIGYWSDRFLADSHTGRDRLLALALLNQEMEMFEPLLVSAREPQWIDTQRGEVKAAVMRTDNAVLVLPVYLGSGAQYVPGQSAIAELKLVVPGVPPNMQPWEVSPGCVRSLHWKRVTGGVEVTLNEFSLTGAIVFTGDPGNPNGLIPRFQQQQRGMSKVAAQWAHDLAVEEIAKVEHVYDALEKAGHPLADGRDLLKRAHTYLENSDAQQRSGDFSEAYLEAQRAMRPLRIIMRASWDQAVKEMGTEPVASQYALSFYTLPQHWAFWQDLQRRRPANNVLPDGDFESANDSAPDGWLMEQVDEVLPQDQVAISAKRVKDSPKVGRQCLLLEMHTKDPTKPAPGVLERSYVAIHSPAVRLQPGTLVKISAWVKVPASIGASCDGALLFDSIGGEPMALRQTGPTNGWKQFAFYRKVPASGVFNVTMALQGLGKVYFDDVRVEPMTAR
jgi:hypothetical protein